LDSITVEKLKHKARYVENQYYASFDKVRQNLDLMKQQHDKLKPLQNQMKTYHSALKKSIDSYQKLVVKQIEIPFFLYCSRLLQSYQGGQGVLIDSKDSKIRFTAPAESTTFYTQ
jgi:exonuclease SbcC